MADHLPLSLPLASTGPIDMRPLGVVPGQQTFLKHDLHGLQNRRVTGLLNGAQLFPHVAHGTGAALPQDAQYGQLCFGRFG